MEAPTRKTGSKEFKTLIPTRLFACLDQEILMEHSEPSGIYGARGMVHLKCKM
jgi:hypothetical protein